MKGYEFDFSTLEGQKLCYIHMYLLINGVIEIDKLLEILDANHSFKMDREELEVLIEELGDVQVRHDYLCIVGLERPLVYQTMKYKNLIGTYKIIDELEEIEKQYNKTILDIEMACNDYFDNIEVINLVRSVMLLSGITSKVLDVFLKEHKIILSNYDKRLLFRKLEGCQKNVRVWSYNGFTKEELFQLKESILENA